VADRASLEGREQGAQKYDCKVHSYCFLMKSFNQN
jgi:hypothetical protein